MLHISHLDSLLGIGCSINDLVSGWNSIILAFEETAIQTVPELSTVIPNGLDAFSGKGYSVSESIPLASFFSNKAIPGVDESHIITRSDTPMHGISLFLFRIIRFDPSNDDY
jgi:hypothetical protein